MKRTRITLYTITLIPAEDTAVVKTRDRGDIDRDLPSYNARMIDTFNGDEFIGRKRIIARPEDESQ